MFTVYEVQLLVLFVPVKLVTQFKP